MKILSPAQHVAELILFIRYQKVMVDADLARIYGVTTKRLNEQVKRNSRRFPADFMFQLTVEEKKELVAKCDRFTNLKHSTSPPFVLTEHGALMLASVLNSQIAVDASIEVVRAFGHEFAAFSLLAVWWRFQLGQGVCGVGKGFVS